MSIQILPRIQQAQQQTKTDRQSALAALNDVFRAGRVPSTPLDGQTHGQMVAMDMGPGLTSLVEPLLTSHMPWCGKTFDAAAATGDNLLYASFKPVARVMFPGYRGYALDGQGRMHAFPFRTYTASGLKDTDRQVLKIDYDTPANPWLMRRILDELVQVDDNYYFGKAYFRLSSSTWHLLFYFALQRA